MIKQFFLKNKNEDVLKIKNDLVIELNEKSDFEKTVIEDFYINDLIDEINKELKTNDSRINAGKIIVFSLLLFLFIISGILLK